MATPDTLPGIDVDRLPGPTRGRHPTLYFRDEPVWSPDGCRVALAYSITEASMANEGGCILWGTLRDGLIAIDGNPSGITACCWTSPWCSWLDHQTFIFKA